MWRETNLFGIYMSPLLVYAATAFVLMLPLRFLLLRTRLLQVFPNPALPQITLFLCILSALLALL